MRRLRNENPSVTLLHACAAQPPENGGQDAGGFQGLMTTFGAVKVGGRNFFKLLQNGEAVLLFPGGVREVGMHQTLFYKV